MVNLKVTDNITVNNGWAEYSLPAYIGTLLNASVAGTANLQLADLDAMAAACKLHQWVDILANQEDASACRYGRASGYEVRGRSPMSVSGRSPFRPSPFEVPITTAYNGFLPEPVDLCTEPYAPPVQQRPVTDLKSDPL